MASLCHDAGGRSRIVFTRADQTDENDNAEDADHQRVWLLGSHVAPHKLRRHDRRVFQSSATLGTWRFNLTGRYWTRNTCENAENYATPDSSAAYALHLATKPPTSDPDLAAIIEAWPTLPDDVKAGILAMVKAASPDG